MNDERPVQSWLRCFEVAAITCFLPHSRAQRPQIGYLSFYWPYWQPILGDRHQSRRRSYCTQVNSDACMYTWIGFLAR